tara:strand:+ start:90 stop:551 length:462 start_codon:yes stop_codon:yes gene_type:complete
MKTSPAGIALIQEYEDCSLTAYPDPKTGGAPWTIGWGTTGPGIGPGLVWTQEECDRRFAEHLEQFERDVMSLVSSPMTQGQFDALVSFAYNCGSDIDADTKAEGLGDSTLLKKFNARDLDGTEIEWMKWVSPGSNVENGLRRRRKAELVLFKS